MGGPPGRSFGGFSRICFDTRCRAVCSDVASPTILQSYADHVGSQAVGSKVTELNNTGYGCYCCWPWEDGAPKSIAAVRHLTRQDRIGLCRQL